MKRVDLDEFVASGVLTRLEAEAIWLHDVKGLSYRAIGLARGRSMQTVYGQARRGHEKLRAWRERAAA